MGISKLFFCSGKTFIRNWELWPAPAVHAGKAASFLHQRVHAHDDGVSVSAQHVHEPEVFRRLSNVRPAGMAASEGSYAVDRLAKVRIRPGTLAARWMVTQPART